MNKQVLSLIKSNIKHIENVFPVNMCSNFSNIAIIEVCANKLIKIITNQLNFLYDILFNLKKNTLPKSFQAKMIINIISFFKTINNLT